MNVLSLEKRAQIVRCLVEGNSIRATVRMTGASKNTITKLLVELGAACSEYQHVTLRNLPCRRVQVDEIWSFCYAKEKNVPGQFKGQPGYGDVWTWTALCADTKLVPSWFIGDRTVPAGASDVAGDARDGSRGERSRLDGRGDYRPVGRGETKLTHYSFAHLCAAGATVVVA